MASTGQSHHLQGPACCPGPQSSLCIVLVRMGDGVTQLVQCDALVLAPGTDLCDTGLSASRGDMGWGVPAPWGQPSPLKRVLSGCALVGKRSLLPDTQQEVRASPQCPSPCPRASAADTCPELPVQLCSQHPKGKQPWDLRTLSQGLPGHPSPLHPLGTSQGLDRSVCSECSPTQCQQPWRQALGLAWSLLYPQL